MFGYEKYIQSANEHLGCDASYVHSVLNPSHEDAAVRIPEPYGRPSTTCQLKYQVIAKSSAQNSQFLAVWNPKQILNANTSVLSYYTDNGTNYVNIQSWTTSVTANNTSGRDFVGVATFARLVSAECRIDYIGRLDESSGMLTCSQVAQSILSTNVNVLESVRDGYFYYGGKAQEGIRMIYMPMDTTDIEYTRVGTYFDADTDTAVRSQYIICGYGLPSDKFLFNIEMTFNIEYIPTVAQIEFVPTGVSTSTLIEESISKITEMSRKPGAVVTKGDDFNFGSWVGGVAGGALGQYFGGTGAASIGSALGSIWGTLSTRNNRPFDGDALLNSRWQDRIFGTWQK